MSQETNAYMYANWLSGMEAAHGAPWWKDAATCNPENHFDGPVPLERVRELFKAIVEAARVFVVCKDGRTFEAPEYAAMVPDDKDAVFGIHSRDFAVDGHQHNEWLIDGPARVIGGDVGITNAGLLRNGARAWVNISTPEEWKTPQGVDFRPNLLFTTAWDGSIASTIKETDVLSVCDNTREAALRSDGLAYRVKHTKNSKFRLADAQAALRLLEQNGNAFAAEIATLCEWQVSEAQFQAFMSQLVPLPEKSDLDVNKRDYSTRTATIAANKREALNELYRLDGRVAPWQGTAFGVLQMVNTHTTHIATQRNAEHRALRNMENVIAGKIAATDNDALAMLAKICERELVAA